MPRQGGEMQGIDGVAGGWIGNSMGGAHGVARVPEAVDPQKGIAAGEVLVGWCPSIGGGDGVGSGMGALATCQLGDERHRVGARAVIGVRGIVVGGTPSITEEPIGRLTRWVARQRYTVVVNNGAAVEEIHRESFASVVLGAEGVDDGVGPEVGDKGVHGEVTGGVLDERETAADGTLGSNDGGTTGGRDGMVNVVAIVPEVVESCRCGEGGGVDVAAVVGVGERLLALGIEIGISEVGAGAAVVSSEFEADILPVVGCQVDADGSPVFPQLSIEGVPS